MNNKKDRGTQGNKNKIKKSKSLQKSRKTSSELGKKSGNV